MTPTGIQTTSREHFQFKLETCPSHASINNPIVIKPQTIQLPILETRGASLTGTRLTDAVLVGVTVAGDVVELLYVGEQRKLVMVVNGVSSVFVSERL
jgi:hypothetical protein